MIHRGPKGFCQQSNYTFYEFQGTKYNMPDLKLTEGFLAAEAVLLFSTL